VERRGSRGLVRLAEARRLAALLALGLAAAASPVAAQTGCTRDGDWLVCDDGRRYAIRQDLDDPRGGRWRGWPPDRGDTAREWPTGERGPLVDSRDGLVCWPHGDHVHCR
jgi:hypothetical protein